jgi:predicted DNA-binding transcriptional regulator AlpA
MKSANRKRVYNVPELSELIGLHTGSIYRVVGKPGPLRDATIRIGRSLFFSKAAVDRWLDGEPAAAATATQER